MFFCLEDHLYWRYSSLCRLELYFVNVYFHNSVCKDEKESFDNSRTARPELLKRIRLGSDTYHISLALVLLLTICQHFQLTFTQVKLPIIYFSGPYSPHQCCLRSSITCRTKNTNKSRKEESAKIRRLPLLLLNPRLQQNQYKMLLYSDPRFHLLNWILY